MELLKNIFLKTRHITLYGLLLAVLIFALKWLQWHFLIADNSQEIYMGLIAVLFTALGVWIAMQLARPKIQMVVIEKEIYISQTENFAINEAVLKAMNLSGREHEVLQLLTKGFSNAEIAENLSLSLSTIKTHVSNLFIKMEVKSRTQAIEKAKRLKIIS